MNNCLNPFVLAHMAEVTGSYRPCQHYLDLRAKCTRPSVVEASGTSPHATPCQEEATTRETLMSTHVRGDDEAIRSADVHTEVKVILTGAERSHMVGNAPGVSAPRAFGGLA